MDYLEQIVEYELTAVIDSPHLAVSRGINWERLLQTLSVTLHTCRPVERQMREAVEREAEQNATASSRFSETAVTRRANEVRRLCTLLESLERGFHTPDMELANSPAMLLIGEAGQGKTHLLCSVAERDLQAKRPRLLFHGFNFSSRDVWMQIIARLGLTCSRDEFLGSLEATAQSFQCRLVILVDALQETDDSDFWKNQLGGFLEVIRNSRWLGVAVSVRSTYEAMTLPALRPPLRLIRIEHHGFSEHEAEASHRYFLHYGIQPTTPPLVPEFSNPLFLKLLCKGLAARGATQIPRGFHGITALLAYFVDAVNAKLSRPHELDYDESENPVKLALNELSRAMAAARSRTLLRERAKQLVDSCLPSVGSYERSLFRRLLSEGVLADEPRRLNGAPVKVERFMYERFGDHLIASELLNEWFDSLDPSSCFNGSGGLAWIFGELDSAWVNRGLVEALSVQVPERCEHELFELVPKGVGLAGSLKRPFWDSLIWRDPTRVSPGALAHIKRERLLQSDDRDDFLEVLVTLAPIAEHKLNANYLDEILKELTLSLRDACWSTFLHDSWMDGKTVSRLINWAFAPNNKSALSAESIELTGIALSWCLTSANRFLRDCARECPEFR